MASMRRDLIYLALIVAFAIFLRVYNMNELTGSDDSQFGEFIAIGVHSAKDLFYNSFPDEPIAYGAFKYNRPAMYIPLYLSTLAFGNTSFGLLFPTLLYTAASIVIMFYLSKKLFGEGIALSATVLFAFSPFHILFSRNALLHAELTMLWLASAYLFMLAVEKKKPLLVYASMALCLANQYTTDYRGLVPLAGLLPYYLLSRPKRRMTMHIMAAGLIFVSVAVGYVAIPYALGDHGYLNWFIDGFRQGVGATGAQNWSDVFAANVGMLIFTPFVGLIVIPVAYGAYLACRRWREPKTAFLLAALMSAGFFIISRQIYFERLVVYTPILAILAAVAFEQKKALPALVSATAGYIMLIPFMMRSFLPEESRPILALLDSLHMGWLAGFLGFVIAASAGLILYMALTKARLDPRLLRVGFIVLMIIAPSVLVVGKIGEFDRPRGSLAISRYLLVNSVDDRYACVSGVYDKAFIYYTKRLCLTFADNSGFQERTVKEAMVSGELRYVVLDPYFDDSDFNARYPALHDLVIANSEDITSRVEGQVDPSFRLLEVNPSVP
jgi:4-amino-4-deoxy-L-arabinose transferase-like glycosyltransferase